MFFGVLVDGLVSHLHCFGGCPDTNQEFFRSLTLLRNLDFPTTIDSSTHDLIADFFVPALKASVRYDRGVGFFSSGWLRIAAEGMEPALW